MESKAHGRDVFKLITVTRLRAEQVPQQAFECCLQYARLLPQLGEGFYPRIALEEHEEFMRRAAINEIRRRVRVASPEDRPEMLYRHLRELDDEASLDSDAFYHEYSPLLPVMKELARMLQRMVGMGLEEYENQRAARRAAANNTSVEQPVRGKRKRRRGSKYEDIIPDIYEIGDQVKREWPGISSTRLARVVLERLQLRYPDREMPDESTIRYYAGEKG